MMPSASASAIAIVEGGCVCVIPTPARRMLSQYFWRELLSTKDRTDSFPCNIFQ
jgi:hypothetical protein